VLVNQNKFNWFSAAELNDQYWNEFIALGSVKSYPAGTMLFTQAEAIENILCLTTGTVKILHLFSNGNEKLLEQLCAPSFLGVEALWSTPVTCYYPAVLAVTDITLISVPLKTAEEFISRRPDMIIAIFQYIRNLLCTSRMLSVTSEELTVVQKTAFSITFMRNAAKDEDGYISVTHDELAKLSGVSRANITTALARLTELKLIGKKRGKIKILDLQALRELAHKHQ